MSHSFSYITPNHPNRGTLLEFRDRMHGAIVHSLNIYRKEFPRESIYGYALVAGQSGSDLGYQLITEERLAAIVDDYYDQGYRYRYATNGDEEHREMIRQWMRWGNPEDDWYRSDFDESLEIMPTFHNLVYRHQAFGEHAEYVVPFLCDDVLATLHESPHWREDSSLHSIILGIESDEADFLTCCIRCNPYPLAIRLRGQMRAGNEVGERMDRIDDENEN